MTYQECVDYILSVPLFAKKLGTDNLNRILDIMGHPEQSSPVIHVAGTNGKGSTCLFLASILEQEGFKVGLFTSPHLLKINERIRIGKTLISDSELIEVFEITMQAIERAKKEGIAHPSFFEFVFLVAAVYFKRQKADYVIYETGMGGLLDATNVVKPFLSIITSVGLDHMQYLGETIPEIAMQKAGIMKPNVPALFFDRKDEATKVIADYSEKIGAKLYLVEKSQYKIMEITDKSIDFSFDSSYYRYDKLKIRKTALYQIENAMLAVRAYEILFHEKNGFCDFKEQSKNRQYSLTDKEIDSIQNGLYNMVWTGRMECIAKNVYVDGAHNEEAMEAFCHTLEVLFPSESKILLFAVSKDKDYEHMIKRLSKIPFDEIIIVRYEGSRSADLDTVEAAFKHFSNSKITTFESLKEGFLYGKEHTGHQSLFCVGSLYLVGNLLKFRSLNDD